MMYDSVDPILRRWASRYDLAVMDEYRGEEVRSLELTDDHGRRYQLWLEPPVEGGRVTVHAWDFRRKRMERVTTISELEQCLEEVLGAVSQWMSCPEKGAEKGAENRGRPPL